MHNPEFRDELKELMYFASLSVKEPRAGRLTCSPSNPETPAAIRAALVIAGDLLTAHLSEFDWNLVKIKPDTNEISAEVTNNDGVIRIDVSLAPIAHTGEAVEDKRFEIAAALYFTCLAHGKMLDDFRDEDHNDPSDGEGIFYSAITGFLTDTEGLEFARHLRMGGPDSPAFKRWMSKHYGDDDPGYSNAMIEAFKEKVNKANGLNPEPVAP